MNSYNSPTADHTLSWDPPEKWTIDAANARATQVFNNPLSRKSLPPEAGLLFAPKAPDFPPFLDGVGNTIAVTRANKSVTIRQIPWLPLPFDMKTPGWMINLYMIFGATTRDMADRVSPLVEPHKSREALANRLTKRCGDYRKLHGGFCSDFRHLKAGRISQNAEAIIMGIPEKRAPLTFEQLYYVRSLTH
jgi:hypothetical protein